jgi:transcriptional regulator with XRE-family HTH domain
MVNRGRLAFFVEGSFLYFMEHWGKRLTTVLKERGVSQREAATIAGVGKSAINSWTTGGSPYNFTAVHRLCEALDISFTWLLIGTETKYQSSLKLVGDFEKEFSFEGFARIRIDALSSKNRK